ncbi:T9SS type A sorting domain-containing protein [Dyadobacter sp. 3J3]|uniref:T9SS type A sorting domain-containing protein n=1 Tax=Dyadobacter sp. 3J3 TaxID=2606600 RepID=UPI0013584220|nr:T9SS type A sorting domain-containing protein [Dyadobacter sp. 3J3]
MKKLILSFLFALIISITFAQDPSLSTANLVPSPAKVGGTITVSFNFQNVSSNDITNPDPDNNPTVIRVSLNKIKPTLNGGNPVVSGAGAAYFNWTAECSGACDGTSDATDVWTVIGLQNSVVPGAPDPFSFYGGPVSFDGTVTTASTSAEASANNGSGFNANIAPGAGGDIDVSPGSNVQSTYTYTDGVLPVTLTYFNAVREGNLSQLSWATTEETNSDHFEIQHSLDGKAWDEIGTVASNGESKALKTYYFTDRKPDQGQNLYRLKMIDRDQTYAYSRIQSVKFEGIITSVDLSVYPNPTSEKLVIRDYKQVTQVKILDMNGRSVYQAGKSDSGEINLRNLSAGIYLVNITRINGAQSSQRILISK